MWAAKGRGDRGSGLVRGGGEGRRVREREESEKETSEGIYNRRQLFTAGQVHKFANTLPLYFL